MPDNTTAGQSSSPARALTLLAGGLAMLLLLGGLGRLPLMVPDEIRNAEVAREMKESGAWLVPTYNGLPYLDKPAFYFKTVALSFDLLGETEAAARLSSALFGLALLGLTYAFCRREYGARTAALAVMVAATAPLYVAFARLVIFDMALAFFVCGAIFAGYLAEQQTGAARSRWYRLATVAAAGATLVKGPVGFLIPALVLAVFHLLNGTRGAIKRFFNPWNIGLFLALTLPWFLGVNHQHPDFAYYGLVKESLRRYTTTEFKRTGPIYYYIPWIFGGFFPWSLLLPGAIVIAWRTRRQWTAADRLLIAWSLVVVVFFSLSQSKRADYILSVMVSLGALTARLCVRAWENPDSGAARVLGFGSLAVAGVSLLAAAAMGMAIFLPDRLAGLWKPGHNPIDVISLTTLRLVCLSLVIVAGLAIKGRRNPRLAVAAFVLLPVAVMTTGFNSIKTYAEGRSARAIAALLPALPPATEIVCCRCFPPGVAFYRQQPVTVLSNDGLEMTSNYILYLLSKTASWPEGIVRLSQAGTWLAAHPQPVYLLAQRAGLADLQGLATPRGISVTQLGPGWWGALLPAGRER